MDKKRQMVFNLNNFLLAFSEVLNSKKVAYIALNLGIKFGFDNKKLADLCSCALIFCLEKNSLKEFDFLDSSHLEDKTFQEIINFSTLICENFDFSKNSINQRANTFDFVKNNKENFSKELIENFFEISKNPISLFKNFETATSFAAFKTTPKSRLFKISSLISQIGYLDVSIFLNSKFPISTKSTGFKISSSQRPSIA